MGKVCETPLGIREVEHPLGFLTSKMDQDGEQYCCRNDEGNKVTKTFFTGGREFIMPEDSGEIISQSPEPQSVSGAGLNTLGELCSQGVLQYRGYRWSQQNRSVIKAGWLWSLPLNASYYSSSIVCGYSCWKLCRASRWLQYCRASRRLLVDSEWGNQGEYQIQ
jgi:hypothetical protein